MEIYDVHLKHPFTMIISGPSGAGKSVWVKRLIERSSFVCKPPPKKIVYFYTEYQPLFSEISGVTFVQGLSENVIQKLGNEPTWIILDDLMDDASDSKVVSDLFTKVSHHRDISVILILQNFFVKGKQMRNITLNSSYIVLMKILVIRTLQVLLQDSSILIDLLSSARYMKMSLKILIVIFLLI